MRIEERSAAPGWVPTDPEFVPAGMGTNQPWPKCNNGINGHGWQFRHKFVCAYPPDCIQTLVAMIHCGFVVLDPSR